MATLTIEVGDEFNVPFKEFMGTMKKFDRFTQQIKRSQGLKVPLQHKPQFTSFSQSFRNLQRSMRRLENILNSSVDRFFQTLGSTARFIVRGLEIDSVFIMPTMSALGAISFGIIPIAISTTTGIFRWFWQKTIAVSQAMVKDRMAALATGTTVGGVRALRVAFGDVQNIETFAQLVAMLKYNQTSRTASTLRALLGIKFQQDAMDTVMQTMLALQRFMQKQPKEISLRTMQMQDLNIDEQVLLQLYSMKPSELQKKTEEYMRLRPKYETPTEVQRMLVGFVVAIRDMWNQIETTLGKKLADLGIVDSLIKIAQAMPGVIDIMLHLPITQDAMKGVERGIEWMGNWLKKTDNIKSLASIINKIIADLERGLMSLADLTGNTKLKEQLGRRQLRRDIGYYDAPGPDVEWGTRATKPTFMWGMPEEGVTFRPGIGPGSHVRREIPYEPSGPTFRRGIGPGTRPTPSEGPTRPEPVTPRIQNVPRTTYIPGTQGLQPRGGIRRTRNERDMELARKQAEEATRQQQAETPTPRRRPRQPPPIVPPGPRFRAPVSPEEAPETIPKAKGGGFAQAGGGVTPTGEGEGRWPRIGEIKAAAKDQLIQEGLIPEQAERGANGLVGQAIAESGLRSQFHDTGKIQGRAGGYVPSIYGADHARGQAMVSWLRSQNLDPEDPVAQSRWMAHEVMSGRFSRSQRALREGNQDEIADALTQEYEAPASRNSPGTLAERRRNAYTASQVGTKQEEGILARYTTKDIQDAVRGKPLPPTVQMPSARPPYAPQALSPRTQPPSFLGGAPGIQGLPGTPSGPGRAGLPSGMGRTGDITGQTSIAELEGNPAAQASIQRFQQAFPNVPDAKTQIYSLVQGESGMGRDMVQRNQYAGYFQLGSDEAYNQMGLTKQQFAALPFHEQMDAYTRWSQRNDPTGQNIRNLGVFNAASAMKWQNASDDTVVYPAGSIEARSNASTWGRYSDAGGAVTVGGIKRYYARNDPETLRQITAAGAPATPPLSPEKQAQLEQNRTVPSAAGVPPLAGAQTARQDPSLAAVSNPRQAVSINPKQDQISRPAPGAKGTMLFLHGMQSRYSQGGVTKSPQEIEADARRYAEAKGYKFEAIDVSGDKPAQQELAARERLKQGDVTAITGFSAGGYTADRIRKDFPNLNYTITGAPRVAGDLEPSRKHMSLMGTLADQAEADAKRNQSQQDQSSPTAPGQGSVTMMNQRAGRSEQLNPRLNDQLNTVSSRTGVGFEVFSGGENPDPRKGFHSGSGRHMHGGAADTTMFVMENGQKHYLNAADPRDRAKIQEVIAESRRQGITGIGVGPGYMEGHEGTAMHLGGGRTALWGAGNTGANAPQYARDAFEDPDHFPAHRPEPSPSEDTTAKDSTHPPDEKETKPKPPSGETDPVKRESGKPQDKLDDAAKDPNKAKPADKEASQGKVSASNNDHTSSKEETHSAMPDGAKVDNKSDTNAKVEAKPEAASE